ncbi:hypothetical protein KR009_007520 [Drosophila setifemur]|nr:hypothetical protein KR009_007520 [Drosophila setifemur]
MWRMRSHNFVRDIIVPEDHQSHTCCFDSRCKAVAPPKLYIFSEESELLSLKEQREVYLGTDHYRRHFKAAQACRTASGSQRVNNLARPTPLPADLEKVTFSQSGGLLAARRSLMELQCAGHGPIVVLLERAASESDLVRQEGEESTDAGLLKRRLLRGVLLPPLRRLEAEATRCDRC